VQRQREDSLTDTQVETSLQLLLIQEIVQRQRKDSQEDSLTDTQVGTSLQLLLTQEIVEKQEEDIQEDSLTDTQVGSASSFCSHKRLYGGRARTLRRTASQILR
jgi:hypothetical protein